MLARNMARFGHHSSAQDTATDEDHIYFNDKLTALRTLRNANVKLLSEVLEKRETCGSNLEVGALLLYGSNHVSGNMWIV
jgi:hypothetical protein